MVKEELQKYFQDRGLDCEGFLLSKIEVVGKRGEKEVILKAEEQPVVAAVATTAE